MEQMPNEQVPESPVNNKKTNVPILVLIFAIAALVGYGVFALANTIWPFASTQDSEIAPLVIKPKTQENISDWKTYRSEEHGFEVRLPLDWTVTENQNKIHLFSPTTQGLLIGGSLVAPPDVTIVRFPNTERLSLDEFTVQYQDGWYESYTTKVAVSLSDYQAIQYSDIDAEIASLPILAVFVVGDESIVLLTLHDDSEDSPRILFDQILSTFKFIEPTGIAGKKISANCPDNFTALQTGGPYYKAGSPNRQSLIEEGVVGEKITVTGFVFDKNCNPISNVWLDFWQADGRGNYDNQGYRLRGFQYTDNDGKYVLETVMPAQYSSRPPHIHLKLQAKEGAPVLTSQLYFPGQSKNTVDTIFNSSLVVSMSDDGKTANYNFKIDTE